MASGGAKWGHVLLPDTSVVSVTTGRPGAVQGGRQVRLATPFASTIPSKGVTASVRRRQYGTALASAWGVGGSAVLIVSDGRLTRSLQRRRPRAAFDFCRRYGRDVMSLVYGWLGDIRELRIAPLPRAAGPSSTPRTRRRPRVHGLRPWRLWRAAMGMGQLILGSVVVAGVSLSAGSTRARPSAQPDLRPTSDWSASARRDSMPSRRALTVTASAPRSCRSCPMCSRCRRRRRCAARSRCLGGVGRRRLWCSRADSVAGGGWISIDEHRDGSFRHHQHGHVP
jgi:hypothetical protein